MATLEKTGDRVLGERLACLCRKFNGPHLVRGTGGHRAQKLILHGLPAYAWIEKPIRRTDL